MCEVLTEGPSQNVTLTTIAEPSLTVLVTNPDERERSYLAVDPQADAVVACWKWHLINCLSSSNVPSHSVGTFRRPVPRRSDITQIGGQTQQNLGPSNVFAFTAGTRFTYY